jgi:O-antigen/teichoic acid export membrane protein
MLPRLRRLLTAPTTMSLFASSGRALNFAIPLPIMMARFEPAQTAVWLMLVTLLTFQNLFMLSFPSVLVRALSYADAGASQLRLLKENVSYADAGQREEQLAGVVGVTRLVFTAILILWILFVGVVGTLLIIRPISQTGSPADSWIAWGLFVVLSPLRIWVQRGTTYLVGLNDVATARRYEGIAFYSSGFLAAAAALTTHSLAWVVLATQLGVAAAATALVRRMRARGWSQLISRSTWAGTRAVLAQVWPSAWRAGLGVLLNVGARQGTGLVFAQMSKPAQSAAYLLALNIAAAIMQLSGAPIDSRLPVLARLRVSGNLPKQIEVAGQAQSGTMWLAALGASAVALCAWPLIGLFGDHVFVAPALWAIMAFAVLIQRHGAAHLQHYSTTNHIVWHWVDGGSGVISILTSILTYRSLGLYGFALGTLLGAIFYSAASSALTYRAFKMPFWRIESRTSVLPVLALAAACTASIVLFQGK